MGTLLRLPRAERRSQLLAAAIGQFAKDGYHRTSMESIATAAGVTKPVLYQHFASKQDLYLEVVDVVGSQLVVELDELAAIEGDADSRIAHGLRSFTAILLDAGTSLRILESSEVISDEVAAAVEEIADRSSAAIANVLRHFLELSQCDAEVLGRALTAVARSSAPRLSRAQTDEEREHLIDLLTRFATDGVSGFPSTPPPDGAAPPGPGPAPEDRPAAVPIGS